MKHLKTYENLLKYKEYEIGDYIVLKEYHEKWNVETHTKIVNKFIPETFKGKPEEYRYLIITYRLNNGNIEKFWVNFWEIERKMTTEEIKDYEIHITTKKYNL